MVKIETDDRQWLQSLNPWYIIVWRCLWLIPVQLFRLGFCLCILFSMGWSEFKRARDDTR